MAKAMLIGVHNVMGNEKLLLLCLKLYEAITFNYSVQYYGLGGFLSCPLTGLETMVKGRRSRNSIEAKCISNFQVQLPVLYKTETFLDDDLAYSFYDTSHC